ncbi:MAG: RNA degradosome polyphosphate kinase, partial [Candidatus Hydrogenedentota bacterium]
HHGGDELVFLSSADWMNRSFDRRIELLAPVEHPACKKKLLEILEACFQDGVKARALLPDGTYQPVQGTGKRRDFRAQEKLWLATTEKTREAEEQDRAVFEPHRPPKD